MVVAHLVEWSLPILEVHSSNPVISKIYIEHLFTINCKEKTKINKKRPEMAQKTGPVKFLFFERVVVS